MTCFFFFTAFKVSTASIYPELQKEIFNLIGRLVGNMVRSGFDGKLRLMLRGFSVCSFLGS